MPNHHAMKLRLDTPGNVKTLAAGDDGDMIIGGHGAVYFNGTPGTEYTAWGVTLRIKAGALSAAAGVDDVRCFFNHDENFLLARTASKTMTLSEDAYGVYYRSTLSPKDPQSVSVFAKVERGDCTGSSMMFMIDESEFTKEDGREIEWVTKVSPLYEMGPVAFPAMTSANSQALNESAIAAMVARRESHYQALAISQQRRRQFLKRKHSV